MMSQLNALALVAKQRHQNLLEEAQRQRAISESRAQAALHATVIGSGIAGLLAARALVDEAERVTIIDRDDLAGSAEYRPGVPQAHHAHTLLPSGQVILEELFPGLVDELLDKGAVAIDASRDIAFFHGGAWHTPRSRPTQVSVGSSRPLLEAMIYQRLADHPKIRVIKGYEAIGLTVDERRQRVTGVRLRDRQGAGLVKTHLPADLVVDASGRTSRAAQWLADLGHAPPEETIVNAFAGYASRLYRHPADFAADWKYLYIRPSAPDQARGGVILPIVWGHSR